jgi:hypothetical protein
VRQPEPSDLGANLGPDLGPNLGPDLGPNLGQVLSRHQGRILAGGWLLYLGVIFAGCAVSWVVATRWWEAAVCAGAAAPMLFVSWRRWNQSATVHEGGIVWRRGQRSNVVRWEEVAEVDAETFDGDFSLTVTTRDGRELVLDESLADVKQLHGYLANALRGQGRGAPSSSTSSSPRW